MKKKPRIIFRIFVILGIIAVIAMYVWLFIPFVLGLDLHSVPIEDSSSASSRNNFVVNVSITESSDGIIINPLSIIFPNSSQCVIKIEVTRPLVSFKNGNSFSILPLSPNGKVQLAPMLNVPYWLIPMASSGVSVMEVHDIPVSNVCATNSFPVVALPNDLAISITPDVTVSSYYYPFDRRHIEINCGSTNL